MSRPRRLLLAMIVAVGVVSASIPMLDAAFRARQYYSTWSYRPTQTYYYRYYYYKPYVNYPSYNYHYCIHYPARPRYVYYYNPHQRVYWGRLDLEGKEGSQYSLLAEADRKERLADIPESAFPEPSDMPVIPESKDDIRIEPMTDIPGDDLPEVNAGTAQPNAPTLIGD